MDPSEVTQLIIIGILLVFSAFFSSAEAAIQSVNKLRIRSLAEDNVKSAKTVNKLIENPGKFTSAILIGNIVANLIAVSIAATLTMEHYGRIGLVIGTGIIMLLILIFCEIIPKTIATIYSEKISLKYGSIINVITIIMTPLIFIIEKVSLGILYLLNINPKAKSSIITEDELRSMVEVSHEEGVIESEERRMITNVVDFGDSLAKDVMVPRIDMVFTEESLSYDSLIELFSIDKYTRLPVYSESRDNVIGILNLKDLFFYNGSKEDFCIKTIMREPYFTYEYKKTSELLIEMRKESIPIAIVLDEYGATAGLITLEDLLEEIVGDIRDEYDDDEEDSIRCISESEYIADGNTKLGEINEVLGLNLESDDYDSIAGHMIYLLDHLPEVGESIVDDNIRYTVDAIDKNRIDKVHIHVLPKEQIEE